MHNSCNESTASLGGTPRSKADLKFDSETGETLQIGTTTYRMSKSA